MRESRPVRLIRKSQHGAAPKAQSEARGHPQNPEREIKNVVSRWVQEHRQHAEEFRRAFAGLVRTNGLPSAS